MAKNQSRRSVSVSRAMYERVKAYCEVNNLSMSEFVEERIGDFLGRPAGAAMKVDDRSAKRVASQIFTF